MLMFHKFSHFVQGCGSEKCWSTYNTVAAESDVKRMWRFQFTGHAGQSMCATARSVVTGHSDKLQKFYPLTATFANLNHKMDKQPQLAELRHIELQLWLEELEKI